MEKTTYTIPDHLLFRSNNPTAEVTSRGKGSPVDFHHRLKDGIDGAITQSWFQTEAETRADIPKHSELYIGEKQVARVFVDRHGNPLTQTDPEFEKRDSTTIKGVLPSGAYPRHQSANMSHLDDEDVLNIYMASIAQGIPMSWGIVRPKFWEIIGEILCFWPSHAPSYGAACISKLGHTVEDLSQYTADNPFDPSAIWVGMPYLSHLEFNGKHTILCGSGHKRLLVVNGGMYDGGAKKPVTFQLYDKLLALYSSMTCQHFALTVLRSRKTISIGQTTAAGKSEGSTSEMNLATPGILSWLFTDEQIDAAEATNPEEADALADAQPEPEEVSVNVSDESELVNPDADLDDDRRVVSDDISVLAARVNGKAAGAEAERRHYWRDDECKVVDGVWGVPFAQDCVEGRVGGAIDYYNEGWDAEAQLVKPYEHVMLDGSECFNPRRTYDVCEVPGVVETGPENLQEIDYMILSIPAPKVFGGWNMPTFVRVTKTQFFAHSLHGARSNKGNPALGAEGEGAWAFEGYGGKVNFSLDTQAMQFARDLKFWNGLKENGSYWIVFNGHSMGGKQRFKFAGSYLLRFLLEHWADELHSAPLIKVPGAFNGGVPDLRTFLPRGGVDERLWNPETLDQGLYFRDADLFDKFCLKAMNTLLGQYGHSPESRDQLQQMVRVYTENRHRPTGNGRKSRTKVLPSAAVPVTA